MNITSIQQAFLSRLADAPYAWAKCVIEEQRVVASLARKGLIEIADRGDRMEVRLTDVGLAYMNIPLLPRKVGTGIPVLDKAMERGIPANKITEGLPKLLRFCDLTDKQQSLMQELAEAAEDNSWVEVFKKEARTVKALMSKGLIEVNDPDGPGPYYREARLSGKGRELMKVKDRHRAEERVGELEELLRDVLRRGKEGHPVLPGSGLYRCIENALREGEGWKTCCESRVAPGKTCPVCHNYPE